jgi:hypothetical protein
MMILALKSEIKAIDSKIQEIKPKVEPKKSQF